LFGTIKRGGGGYLVNIGGGGDLSAAAIG